MKIALIIGMPGSGKTTLGRSFPCFIDDITADGLEELKAAINRKEQVIAVADCYLCFDKTRANAVKWLTKNAVEYKIEFIFFENNKEKCIRNVNRRMKNGDNRKVFGLIETLSKVYLVPENERVLAIYEN